MRYTRAGWPLISDLQLAMGGTKGELDVACDHRPLAGAAAELVEPRRARHPCSDFGLQLDQRHLPSGRRQRRGRGEGGLRRREAGLAAFELSQGVAVASAYQTYMSSRRRHRERATTPNALRLLRASPPAFSRPRIHCQLQCRSPNRDRTGQCEHHQRQQGRFDSIGRVSRKPESSSNSSVAK